MTTSMIERTVTREPLAVDDDPDTLVLIVRQDHINRGQILSSTNCPIALAAIEAGYRDVAMGSRLYEGRLRLWFCPEALEFASAFDKGRPVYPDRFVFTRVK
jgi:hypothetical protein